MTTDPTIREQAYQYFLQEAPELLQVLEQGLLSLQQDSSIHQVNTLMRATHTLKGAANSVGLETIATISHSLEDIFRALCRPNVSIDAEVKALLFEGFECLHLALRAELAGSAIQDTEVLDRTASIFVQLQEKLRDCFDQDAPLPTSVELGFDVTQSIFEVGVAQRLDQLAAALDTADLQEIAMTLQTQAEVFLGLGESLNLSGFGAIAASVLAALKQHPEQVMTIAQQALVDFQAGQAAVLAGDRDQGGIPSAALEALAGGNDSVIHWSGVQDAESRDETYPVPPEASDSLLEAIWGELEPDCDREVEANERSEDNTPDVSENHTPDAAVPIPAQPLPLAQFQPSPQIPRIPSPLPKNPTAPSPAVRVNVEHLDQLNHAVGELLTNQNRQSLQIEQLQAAVRNLYGRLRHHQQLLNRLQDWTDQQPDGWGEERSDFLLQFDVLELDRYSDTQLVLQSLLDDQIQLTEAVDAVDLFTRQTSHTQEKQRRLLIETRDALIEARMLPLGHVLERFPQVLQQLTAQHDKSVTLELQGTEVLVDKVIAEKLYEPLLHLVRNAFDHGIEPKSVRQQRGKSERGQITIAAHHQGKYLVIEVQDDGQGLDYERIRQRATDRHLITPEQAYQLSPTQLADLLFQPGFSTASKVSNLSGRGIGLDIVRSQLQTMQGTVTVASALHQGTTFTLRIPLSLTIAKLLLCQAGSRVYALLPDAIAQIVIPQTNQLQTRQPCKVLQWQDGAETQQVPVYSLAALLEDHAHLTHQTAQPESAPVMSDDSSYVLLIRYQGMVFGLEVERMLGEQELVIRPLGSLIPAPPYVYGASILADGQLSLVLDGTALVQKVCDPLIRPVPNPKTELTPHLLNAGAELSDSLLPPSLPESELKPRILIVDDSITARQTLTLTLQKSGYQVLQAKDGYDAIAQLQMHSQIQLVICDVEMPRMNGFEFLTYCQQEPTLAQLPVIMLTSRSGQKHRLLAEQLGAMAYISKPYLEHKLLEIVSQILNQSLQTRRVGNAHED